MERIKALNDDINHLFCQMLSLTPVGRIFQTDRGPSSLGTRKHMCKGMEAPECLACLGNEDFGVYGASDGAICCVGSVAGDRWN